MFPAWDKQGWRKERKHTQLIHAQTQARNTSVVTSAVAATDDAAAAAAAFDEFLFSSKQHFLSPKHRIMFSRWNIALDDALCAIAWIISLNYIRNSIPQKSRNESKHRDIFFNEFFLPWIFVAFFSFSFFNSVYICERKRVKTFAANELEIINRTKKCVLHRPLLLIFI